MGRMKLILAVLLLCSCCYAETCLIIKHASVSRQMWVSGANWQYVAGDFPQGLNFHGNITDRYIRKIKQRGGKVVTVPEKHTVADLEQAKAECAKKEEGK